MNTKDKLIQQQQQKQEQSRHEASHEEIQFSKSFINTKMISEHFQCGICQGYIIDATTITECLHSCKQFKLKYI
jgi:hypothetical protein